MAIIRFAFIVAFYFLVTGGPNISDGRTKNRPSSVRLIAGLGPVHHPVSTKNQEAQKFFDQGLALVYGFNHEEARRSFEHAAELDPNLAMAWWGVALALGPNYNFPVDPERAKAAYEAVQRAIALQEKGSAPERAYISALAFRFSNDPKVDRRQLDLDYRNAMAKLVTGYPDDLDAATLYADSLMNLNPWKLWFHDGRPNEGTEEIVAVLESVLKRDPNHLGANHYYIHALEASPHPERALASALRLEKLAPAAGHLLHMPSHIYSRVGDHVGSVRVNANAVAADQKFMKRNANPGMEAVMLAFHNLHFLAYAHCMSGNFSEAKRAADKLFVQVQPHVKEMPMLEGLLPTSLFVLIAFERWNDIAALPAPDSSFLITNAVWHFARGVAFANLGKTDLAEKEQSAWKQSAARVPNDTIIIALNNAGAIFKVHQHLLAAAIRRSRHDSRGGIDLLKQAVAADDALNYDEPPDWFPSVRSTLGKVLLENKQYDEAEQVFRADLEKNPRNGRSLAGLRDSLTAQNRLHEAQLVDAQFRAAWNVATSRAAAHRKR